MNVYFCYFFPQNQSLAFFIKILIQKNLECFIYLLVLQIDLNKSKRSFILIFVFLIYVFLFKMHRFVISYSEFAS